MKHHRPINNECIVLLLKSQCLRYLEWLVNPRSCPFKNGSFPLEKPEALSSLFSRRAILKLIRFTAVDIPVMAPFKI